MQALLNLLAGIALLVWGTHIVRSGIMRSYGGDLRRVLATHVNNRFNAFLAGIGVTGLLQSSTATALITTSFVGQRLIATAPALAIMLGADVGTSLVVQLLSFDLSWLWPLLIFAGVVMFLSREHTAAGRCGHIAIGFGLILLALQLIVLASRPLTQAASVKVAVRVDHRRRAPRHADRGRPHRAVLFEPGGGTADLDVDCSGNDFDGCCARPGA